MEASFWLSRWAQDKTGFHLDQVNAHLLSFGPAWLEAAPGGEQKDILVPLCGKSRDLFYLASIGHRVVGVELSEKAARSAFNEAKLAFSEQQIGDFLVLRAKTLDMEIRVGDFFKLPAQPAFDAVWDRAAIVALDPERRLRYTQHLPKLLRPGAVMLVSSLDYPQEQMAGPPHAVSHQDLVAFYGKKFDLVLLSEEEQIDNSPKFRARGLDTFVQRLSQLTLKA